MNIKSYISDRGRQPQIVLKIGKHLIVSVIIIIIIMNTIIAGPHFWLDDQELSDLVEAAERDLLAALPVPKRP